MQQTSTDQPVFTGSAKRTGGLLIAALLLMLVMGVGTARAEFGVASFDGEVVNRDAGGNAVAATQAGEHPDEASTTITFNTHLDPVLGFAVPDADVKNIHVDLPPGFIGNPNATPTKCTAGQLADESNPTCPFSSQVGIVIIRKAAFLPAFERVAFPVFNMVVPPGVPAAFGFNAGNVPVYLTAELRSGADYGLTVNVNQISQGLPLLSTTLTFWGVPAASTHDNQRCLNPTEDAIPANTCIATPGDPNSAPHSVDSAPKPFLTNPTSCSPAGTGLETKLSIDSWPHPGDLEAASFFTHLTQPNEAQQQGPQGCDRVPFDATLTATPSSRTAGAPSGYAFDLQVPQDENPRAIAQGHLKKAVVTLPDGVAVSASAASGLGACSSAEVDLSSAGRSTCPDSSKIGTVRIDTPLLDDPLTGEIYLAKQNDNPFGSLLALYIVAHDYQRGLIIKLPGKIDADPTTGRLTATFDNNPQLPFSNLHLEFKDGPRAPLVNPSICGTKTVTSALTSWSGKSVTSQSSFTIDQSCDVAGRFGPSLTAGFADAQAGDSSPFTLELSRPSGEQDIAGLNVTLAPGVLANVGSVPLCPESQASAGTCDRGSQVGHVIAAAGAGSAPVSVPQPGKAPTAVYLAGPYKGAPFSLSIVVPAQAGPFDLGTVVVRAALFVDPIDAHVTVVSEPLPTILDGIPLLMQKLVVSIDRPGFMVAPTNCDEMAVTADVRSSAGAIAHVANRLQMAECGSLVLKPKLDLTLSGKGQTTDGKHPAINAVVTQSAGQANLKRVRVALPLSLALDPDNANGLCEFVDGSKVEPTCPKASIVGSAVATTPILDEPLSGPVYFVKNIRKDPKSGREIRTLPKLVIPLVGQNGVKLTLTGTSAVEDDQLVTTFDNIPDAPVSSFKLNIIGGKGGILTVSGADICKATQIADQQIDGQNSKNADADVFIQTPSCPLRVLSKKVGKTGVAIKVGGLSAGTVTVTGRGIKKTSKTIAKSTVATITARRIKGTPGKVTVSFDPTGPAKAHKTTK
jgi:hypothetical protein